MTWRPLDTGDSEEDFLIPMNENINMVWSFRSDDADWRIHIRRGYFNVSLDKGMGNPDYVDKINIDDVEVVDSDTESETEGGKIADTVDSESDESEADEKQTTISDEDFINGKADVDI